MLGANSKYAEQCYKEGFIGADYDIHLDLTNHLPENWDYFQRISNIQANALLEFQEGQIKKHYLMKE